MSKCFQSCLLDLKLIHRIPLQSTAPNPTVIVLARVWFSMLFASLLSRSYLDQKFGERERENDELREVSTGKSNFKIREKCRKTFSSKLVWLVGAFGWIEVYIWHCQIGREFMHFELATSLIRRVVKRWHCSNAPPLIQLHGGAPPPLPESIFLESYRGRFSLSSGEYLDQFASAATKQSGKMPSEHSLWFMCSIFINLFCQFSVGSTEAFGISKNLSLSKNACRCTERENSLNTAQWAQNGWLINVLGRSFCRRCRSTMCQWQHLPENTPPVGPRHSDSIRYD